MVAALVLSIGKKSVTTLAGHGAVDVLLKILKIELSESSIMEETIVLVHSILARIAAKGNPNPFIRDAASLLA